MAPRQRDVTQVETLSFLGGSAPNCPNCDSISVKKMLKTKTTRLSLMLVLVTVYFLVEVVVGNLTNSLTLVANSFHMFSDALSLLIGLAAARMSKRTAKESFNPWGSSTKYFNTFGWGRFEVVGALVNSTFLLAISVSIFVEAIGKFFIPPELITHPELVLAIGGGGLLLNIVGMLVFGSFMKSSEDYHRSHTTHSQHISEMNENTKKKTNSLLSGEHMNIKAVFLHVMGDAMGSIIVMVAASLVRFTPHNEGLHTSATSCGEKVMNGWVIYLDPAMSLIQVIIIVTSTFPLFKQSCLILLQTVPAHIQINKLREKISRINGVKKIHDFHVWQLSGAKLVASLHLQCDCDVTEDAYMGVANKIKEELHIEGIHSTTVQCS